MSSFSTKRKDNEMKKLTILLVLLGATSGAQPPVPAPEPGLQRVTQICIVTRDIEATSKRWAAVLGVAPPSIKITRPGPEVRVMYRGRPSTGQARIASIRLGQVSLEILQPVGPDTSWREFLDANGEGVQHIAFGVADLDGTVKRFASMGMPVMHQGRLDGDNGNYTYFDSKSALGVTVELLNSDAKKP